MDLAIELGFANLIQDDRELRSRLEAVPDQVMTGDQRRRIDGSSRLKSQVILAVVDVLGIARRRQRVGAVKRQELVDSGLRQDPLELRLAQLLGLAQVLMVGDQPGNPVALGVGEFQAEAEPVGDPGADLLVVMEADPAVVEHPGGRLTDVVQQRGECQT